MINPLSTHYAVVAPNNPGSADMPIPDHPLELDDIADRIVATASRAGLDTFAVLAQSMGAAIAARLATRHPERVQALVLVAGFARARNSLRLNLDMVQALRECNSPVFGDVVTAISWSEQYLNTLPESEVDQLRSGAEESEPGLLWHIDLARRIDVRAELPAIRTPTLVVATERDRFVSPDHGDDFTAGIGHARRASLDAGHCVTIERTDELANLVTRFLDR